MSLHDVEPAAGTEVSHLLEELRGRVGNAISAAVIAAPFGRTEGSGFAAVVRECCREVALHGYSHSGAGVCHPLGYVEDPVAFLKEARRVCRSRIVLVQTTCDGIPGIGLHWCNEWISRLGFHAARFFGLIARVPCPVQYRRSLSREAVLQAAQSAGLRPESLKSERLLRLLPMSRLTCSLLALETDL